MRNKAKKCKKCGKLLNIKNKSGLCSYHYVEAFKLDERGGKNDNN